MTIFDCLACTARSLLSDDPTYRTCPACGRADVLVEPALEDVCNAPFPDASDTRCLARPHAEGEHDPQHRGVNPATGSEIVWRSSEFGP